MPDSLQGPLGTLVLSLVFTFSCLLQSGSGNSALLSSTLYTFQKTSCEGETLKMRCPKGSLVSIQFGQYGRQEPSSKMCPYTISPNGSVLPQKVFNSRVSVWEDTNCLATTSLQVILNICQDQKQCHLAASTKTFKQDPCPGTRKYLKVSYKCRPNEFKSETVCEGEKLRLRCPKPTRIAIFSGLYGRTPGGNAQCPSKLPGNAANGTNCQSRGATEEVMTHCHGSRKCTIDADDSVFGNPCPHGVPKYLTVVYTCVVRRVLLSTYRHKVRHPHNKDLENILSTQPNANIPNLSEEPEDKVLLQTTKAPSPVPEEYPRDAAERPGLEESRLKPGKSGNRPGKKTGSETTDKEVKAEAGPSTHCNNLSTVAIGSSQREPASTGLLIDWLNAFNFLEKNKEKAVLYLVLGIAFGLICLLILVIVRLCIVNQRKSKAKLDISEPVHADHPAPSNHIEAPTLERSESLDRIEVVRFSPRPRDYATCTLRSDIGNRSLTNYYG